MQALQNVMGSLRPHGLYRLHHRMENERLRGALVVYYERRVFTIGDIPRCRVRLVNDDGSVGDEYLVRYSCIINV